MAKILVSESNAYIPIIRQFHQDGHEIIVTRPEFGRTLGNLDIPHKPLGGYLSAQGRENAMAQAAKGLYRLRQVSKNGKFQSSLPSNEAVKDFLNSDKLHGYAFTRFGEIAGIYAALEEAKPDVVMLHNDVEPFNRAVALWGLKRDVPVVHIPHAIYHDLYDDNDIHRVVTAQFLCSSGPFQSGWYVGCGMNPLRIKETGLPQYDEFARLVIDPERYRQRLGLSTKQPVITYCDSWPQNTNMTGMHDGITETFRNFLKIVTLPPFKSVQVVVKLHPRDRTGDWRQAMAKEMGATKEHGRPIVIVRDYLPPVLMASNLVIAYGPSNVLLEAAHIPYLKLAATWGFEKDREISTVLLETLPTAKAAEMLLDLLASPAIDTSHLLGKYLGPCDGNNHRRVYQAITGLL